ncbi:MAG: hypothetical protein P4L52_01635 [Acidocella sp.]|nr:hypothetical protein [Acidocella sp.]
MNAKPLAAILLAACLGLAGCGNGAETRTAWDTATFGTFAGIGPGTGGICKGTSAMAATPRAPHGSSP